MDKSSITFTRGKEWWLERVTLKGRQRYPKLIRVGELDRERVYVPELTCRNASLDPECFRCSECGAEDYTSDSLTMWHDGGPVDICYFPVCGRKLRKDGER